MVFAEVGFAELFWTVVWLFFVFTFIWVFVALVSDLFRDHELSGPAKALWLVALIVFPLIGSLVYILVRGQSMAERSARAQQAARAEFDSYVRSAAASTGTSSVDDLTRLSELRSNGTITDAEFESMKARLVGGDVTA
jgi:ABC-type multidrug transport system fused ATPase/permease subunit